MNSILCFSESPLGNAQKKIIVNVFFGVIHGNPFSSKYPEWKNKNTVSCKNVKEALRGLYPNLKLYTFFVRYRSHSNKNEFKLLGKHKEYKVREKNDFLVCFDSKSNEELFANAQATEQTAIGVMKLSFAEFKFFQDLRSFAYDVAEKISPEMLQYTKNSIYPLFRMGTNKKDPRNYLKQINCDIKVLFSCPLLKKGKPPGGVFVNYYKVCRSIEKKTQALHKDLLQTYEPARLESFSFYNPTRVLILIANAKVKKSLGLCLQVENFFADEDWIPINKAFPSLSVLKKTKLLVIIGANADLAAEAFYNLGVPYVVSVNRFCIFDENVVGIFIKNLVDRLLCSYTISESVSKAINGAVSKISQLNFPAFCCCSHRHRKECNWAKFNMKQNFLERHMSHLPFCDCDSGKQIKHYTLCDFIEEMRDKFEFQVPEEEDEFHFCCCPEFSGFLEGKECHQREQMFKIFENEDSAHSSQKLFQNSGEKARSDKNSILPFNTHKDLDFVLGADETLREVLTLIENAQRNETEVLLIQLSSSNEAQTSRFLRFTQFFILMRNLLGLTSVILVDLKKDRISSIKMSKNESNDQAGSCLYLIDNFDAFLKNDQDEDLGKLSDLKGFFLVVSNNENLVSFLSSEDSVAEHFDVELEQELPTEWKLLALIQTPTKSLTKYFVSSLRNNQEKDLFLNSFSEDEKADLLFWSMLPVGIYPFFCEEWFKSKRGIYDKLDRDGKLKVLSEEFQVYGERPITIALYPDFEKDEYFYEAHEKFAKFIETAALRLLRFKQKDPAYHNALIPADCFEYSEDFGGINLELFLAEKDKAPEDFKFWGQNEEDMATNTSSSNDKQFLRYLCHTIKGVFDYNSYKQAGFFIFEDEKTDKIMETLRRAALISFTALLSSEFCSEKELLNLPKNLINWHGSQKSKFSITFFSQLFVLSRTLKWKESYINSLVTPSPHRSARKTNENIFSFSLTKQSSDLTDSTLNEAKLCPPIKYLWELCKWERTVNKELSTILISPNSDDISKNVPCVWEYIYFLENFLSKKAELTFLSKFSIKKVKFRLLFLRICCNQMNQLSKKSLKKLAVQFKKNYGCKELSCWSEFLLGMHHYKRAYLAEINDREFFDRGRTASKFLIKALKYFDSVKDQAFSSYGFDRFPSFTSSLSERPSKTSDLSMEPPKIFKYFSKDSSVSGKSNQSFHRSKSFQERSRLLGQVAEETRRNLEEIKEDLWNRIVVLTSMGPGQEDCEQWAPMVAFWETRIEEEVLSNNCDIIFGPLTKKNLKRYAFGKRGAGILVFYSGKELENFESWKYEKPEKTNNSPGISPNQLLLDVKGFFGSDKSLLNVEAVPKESPENSHEKQGFIFKSGCLKINDMEKNTELLIINFGFRTIEYFEENFYVPEHSICFQIPESESNGFNVPVSKLTSLFFNFVAELLKRLTSREKEQKKQTVAKIVDKVILNMKNSCFDESEKSTLDFFKSTIHLKLDKIYELKLCPKSRELKPFRLNYCLEADTISPFSFEPLIASQAILKRIACDISQNGSLVLVNKGNPSSFFKASQVLSILVQRKQISSKEKEERFSGFSFVSNERKTIEQVNESLEEICKEGWERRLVWVCLHQGEVSLKTIAQLIKINEKNTVVLGLSNSIPSCIRWRKMEIRVCFDQDFRPILQEYSELSEAPEPALIIKSQESEELAQDSANNSFDSFPDF